MRCGFWKAKSAKCGCRRGDTDGMTADLLKMAAILLMIVNWDSLDPENRMQFFGSSATRPWCYGAS